METFREALKELLALKGTSKFMAGYKISLVDLSLGTYFPILKMFHYEESQELQEWFDYVEHALPELKNQNEWVDYGEFAGIEDEKLEGDEE